MEDTHAVDCGIQEIGIYIESSIELLNSPRPLPWTPRHLSDKMTYFFILH